MTGNDSDRLGTGGGCLIAVLVTVMLCILAIAAIGAAHLVVWVWGWT